VKNNIEAMLTDTSYHSSEDEDHIELIRNAFSNESSYSYLVQSFYQIGGAGERKGQDIGDANGDTKEDKKECLIEKIDAFLTRNRTDDVIISPSKELIAMVDFTKTAVEALPDSEFKNFVQSLTPSNFSALIQVKIPWRELKNIVEETKNAVETNPKDILHNFVHQLGETDIRTLVKVAGSKTKNTNVRCEAVRNIIFRGYIKPIQKLQKQLKEDMEMLATTANLVLTTQVSDNTGKIQWNSAYQDFLLDCLHKGCNNARKPPTHHYIASDDDPMEGLMHDFGNLGNNDDDDDDDGNGHIDMPEPKKRGRPPSKKQEGDKSN
jgi:hypothetical protein